jgi:pyruvate kinase
MKHNAIVTIPPYAPFIKEVASHSLVSGVRLNTVMPTKEPLEDLLKRLQDTCGTKDIWIDLKARQLRVKGYWVPPFTEIEVSHPIQVHVPTQAYFHDGKECATLVAIDKNRLIFLEGPKRVVGPGESLNIPDPSLVINGFLTDTDKRYIEAAEKLNLKNYMLSFVESAKDVSDFKKIIPDANLVAKIESPKGLFYVMNDWSNDTRLMTARGDLFIEVARPHLIAPAMHSIVRKDPNAILASRIFNSLSTNLEPSCTDITDVYGSLLMGYKTFMLGDDVCMARDSVVSSLNLLSSIVDSYNNQIKSLVGGKNVT